MHTKPRAITELLAPAGSWEALVAAVAAGADAVYLGGTHFSARQFAANFDDAALKEAVTYAHARGVRVYVTVNTLLHDTELPGAARYLLFLYEIGVDAVLVQDVGLLRLARALVPDLPIHASTQMAVTSEEGVRWAAAHGIERVVLARELPLAEVEGMRAAVEETGIGLEVFLHGALCYAYSGQCLLSSVIGGRSGNRGACAQPCRKPYTLLRGDLDLYGRPVGFRPVRLPDAYRLSTRDICLYPALEEVVRAPVASLKIEGRMKTPAYVATVVSVYRRALDALAAGDPLPDPIAAERDLALAFTRGFTGGYLCGERHRGVIGPERPDNRGVALGTVTAFSDRWMEATVALATGDLLPENGDGLAVRWPGGEFGLVVRGTPRVRDGTLRLRFPQPAPIGAEVVVTRRAALEAQAAETVRVGRPCVRIDATVTWDEGGTPVVAGLCTPPRGEAAAFRVRADEPMGRARTRPLGVDVVRDHLGRTGGTQFFIGRLDLRYPGGLFAPASYLNALRRQVLAAAASALVEAARPTAEAVAAARERLAALLPGLKGSAAPDPAVRPALAVLTDTPEGVSAVADAGADLICFEPSPSACRPGSFEAAVGTAGDRPLIWKWPRIVTRTFLDAAIPLLPAAHAAGIAGVMVEGHGCADAVRRTVPGMPLYGGAGLNIWNHAAVAAHADFAILTLSPELSGEEVRTLAARVPAGSPALALLVQGTVEAAVTEDCPPATALGCPAGCSSGKSWALKDERGRVFPLRPAGACRTAIGNAVETCLIDYLPDLAGAGIATFIIDARWRGPAYAGEMTGLYREALGGPRNRADLDRLKTAIKTRALGGITAASYLYGTGDGSKKKDRR
ncbi:U32 family peptidase [Methanofollis formosanus]|uniref:U32 family peptidase n=1 Tax=Methanofollis formosanus TaxID=299308 RepID=A0A8G1A355_9EURY|nr:U32 family peptidase [Methanofollis formosanus]QYZ79539.1 U32 family peptidase [Methanofollis formosanus]